MSDSIDFADWALIISVAALFVWYFWHVATSLISGARRISEITDGAAARQRAELEYEAKFGPRPLWYRAMQKLVLTALFGLSAWLVWDMIQG